MKQLLNCLKKASDNNWHAYLHNADGLTNTPLAQFHLYSHAHDKVFISCVSMECFLDFVVSMKNIPSHLTDPTVAASALSDAFLALLKADNKESQAALASCIMFYMITTNTGQQYFSMHNGKPFAFFASLYPDNKKATRFLVRPIMSGESELLDGEGIKEMCEHVALLDKQNGKKEYFRYLKLKKAI